MSHARQYDQYEKKNTQKNAEVKVPASIPATSVSVSAGATAAVAQTETKTPETTLQSLFNNQQAPMRHHMLPCLDSNAIAYLSEVSVFAKALPTQDGYQRGAKRMIDLTLRGEVSDLFLMQSPNNEERSHYETSDERHLYLYKGKDGREFYYYKGSEQKHYLSIDEKQQPVNFKSHSFNSTPGNRLRCVDEALRKSVFDITVKRQHTLRSDSEEIKKMTDKIPELPFVAYQPQTEADSTIRNRGGQLINLVGKTPLQVAYGEEHDYAIKAMTDKLLSVSDEKHQHENAKKIQAQRDAQYALGSKQEEKEKAERLTAILVAQATLTQAVLESKGDIQDSGAPAYKLTLSQEKGGERIKKAIAELEASLKAVRDVAVKTGRHYNPEPQSQAMEEYDYLSNSGRACNSPEMQFLFRNIGRYQGMMSLGYAHGFCGDGLYDRVRKLQVDQIPRESTAVKVWDSNRKRWSGAVDLYSVGGLGVDFAIGECGGEPGLWRWQDGRSGVFKSYVNQKQQAHRTVMPQQRDRRPEPPKSSCVIM